MANAAIAQDRGGLARSLKARELIQHAISLCSVRIQANSFRIFLSSFSMFPAFINPAWRRNVVEFGGFIAFEGNRAMNAIQESQSDQ
jgi:hypothetical protein